MHRTFAALGLAFVLSAPAVAATTDPEVIIYRFSGIFDDGGSIGAGTATSLFCTNFSGVPENVRFVTRADDGTLLVNTVTTINHLTTKTASTHTVNAYVTQVPMTTGLVRQGSTAIAATSINVVCTGATIDANNAKPVGVPVRGIRFNPAPGSQE